MIWLDRRLILGPYLALCLNQKEFKQALRHVGETAYSPRFVSHGAGATTHTLRTERGLVCLVCFEPVKKGTSIIQVHALLLHEAVHVWQEHCKDIGDDSPSAETEAYAIQNIALALFREYERRK